MLLCVGQHSRRQTRQEVGGGGKSEKKKWKSLFCGDFQFSSFPLFPDNYFTHPYLCKDDLQTAGFCFRLNPPQRWSIHLFCDLHNTLEFQGRMAEFKLQLLPKMQNSKGEKVIGPPPLLLRYFIGYVGVF